MIAAPLLGEHQPSDGCRTCRQHAGDLPHHPQTIGRGDWTGYAPTSSAQVLTGCQRQTDRTRPHGRRRNCVPIVCQEQPPSQLEVDVALYGRQRGGRRRWGARHRPQRSVCQTHCVRTPATRGHTPGGTPTNLFTLSDGVTRRRLGAERGQALD